MYSKRRKVEEFPKRAVMAQTAGSIISVKKREKSEAYVVNFGTSGRALIDIKCPFGVGKFRIDACVSPQELNNAATDPTPIWCVYIKNLSGDEIPVAHYIPVQHGVSPNPNNKCYEFTFDTPKRFDGLTEIMQASSLNDYNYVANSVPAYTDGANNKIHLRITYYEY